MSRRNLPILLVLAAVVGVVIAKRAREAPPTLSAGAAVQTTPSERAEVPSPAARPSETGAAPATPKRSADYRNAAGATDTTAPGTPEAAASAASATLEAAGNAEGDVRENTADAGPETAEPLPGSKLVGALKSGQPTMADFGAGWCKACKMMEPVLAQAAAKYAASAHIVYVDTEAYAALAKQYRITAIPTQIFFDAKGREIARHVGYWPIEEIDKQLAALGVGR